MTGAVKYKPYALLSATTQRKAITMSMCVRGNEEDREIVERFFDLFEKNLDALTNSDLGKMFCGKTKRLSVKKNDFYATMNHQ